MKVAEITNTRLSSITSTIRVPKASFGCVLSAIRIGTNNTEEPMADNGLWFKLWCASLDDADLDNLDIADFGRWAKLGTYIKQHGQAGEVKISAPARTLCAMFQVVDFQAFHVAVSRLPNVQTSIQMRRAKLKQEDETILTVSFANWSKYQGDFSTGRVRKFREMKRFRGEERRREEKRYIRSKSNTAVSPDILLAGTSSNGSQSSTAGEEVISKPQQLTVTHFISFYNDLRPEEWKACMKPTDGRKKKYAAYLKQFAELGYWDSVFAELHLSPWLLGKKPDKDGRCFSARTLDWLCQRGKDGLENCQKVYEQRYRPQPEHQPPAFDYNSEEIKGNPLSRDPT